MENLSKYNKTNQPHHPIQAENNPPTPIIPNNTRQNQNYVSNKQDHEPDRNRNSTTKRFFQEKKVRVNYSKITHRTETSRDLEYRLDMVKRRRYG